MARIGYAGGIAIELFNLRTRNAELEPIARQAKNLQSVVDDLSRENLELRRALYREKFRNKQNNGKRRRPVGGSDHSSGRASSSDASAS